MRSERRAKRLARRAAHADGPLAAWRSRRALVDALGDSPHAALLRACLEHRLATDVQVGSGAPAPHDIALKEQRC